MSNIDKCLDASLLITRAAGARGRASQALKMMNKDRNSLGWLRRYVAASAMLEEAEIELLTIKRGMGK